MIDFTLDDLRTLGQVTGNALKRTNDSLESLGYEQSRNECFVKLRDLLSKIDGAIEEQTK